MEIIVKAFVEMVKMKTSRYHCCRKLDCTIVDDYNLRKDYIFANVFGWQITCSYRRFEVIVEQYLNVLVIADHHRDISFANDGLQRIGHSHIDGWPMPLYQ